MFDFLFATMCNEFTELAIGVVLTD